MKRKNLCALILALVMVFALVACGGSGGSNTPGNASAPDDKSYNLVYSYFGPGHIGPGLFMTKIAEEIERETDGRLTFDIHFNGTLLGTGDVIAGCINGVADIVVVDSSVVGEVFLLNNVFSMPFMNTPPSKPAMDKAFNNMIENVPELNEELASQNLMWLNIAPAGGYHLHGVSKLFDSPSSLAGYMIDGLGEGGNLIIALGGNGITMDPGDWYLSLSTGLLDGMLAHFAMMRGFTVDELLTTHVIFSNTKDPADYESLFGGGLYAPIHGYVMNIDSYNNLPADLQKLLTDKMSDYARFCTEDFNMPDEVIPSINMSIERGDQFIFVGDNERGEWAFGIQAILDKWFSACDAAGYDGRALYDYMLEQFAAY
ncbi:MAG: hypothetical protein FWG32_05320 [Oscillospiraceae bacterium]|nr:hypothetical protein [Oscillospiraceae bacterium]